MASSTEVLRSGLNLMRRLPPRDVRTNLSGLTVLRPELSEEWLQRVDAPLAVKLDAKANKKYLLCDYNRDGDSYRSPWSNTYDPPLEDGFTPSDSLRAVEIAANEVWEAYRDMYYESSGSVSSVYMWDLDKGFAGCWLVKKGVFGRTLCVGGKPDNAPNRLLTKRHCSLPVAEIGAGRFLKRGCWDSIHVIEAAPGGSDGKTSYKLTSTVLLSLVVERPETAGTVDLSGSITRQASATHAVTAERSHVVNMGTMIEAMEADMRGSLDALYISKTKEIVSGLHAKGGGAGAAASRVFVADLSAAVKRHGPTPGT